MVQFTKQLSGLLIVGTVLFSACKSSETTPTDSLSLGLHQSGRLGSDVVVRVDSIQDSRCPPGGICIWAGEAKVKLLLSTATDSSAVSLTLGAANKTKRTDSTGVTLSNQLFKVVLRAVGPYPAQTATVQIAKL